MHMDRRLATSASVESDDKPKGSRMVRITEDLVRKKAEHNNCELSTLEEVSLHQLDIERIELLDKVCRELKILYLQSNLIPKIENVGRLKKLEYLNLALNNVEKIENLEGCESLQKLDLTVNFVGELTSIASLQDNCHLRELFLTGNPCTQFTGYREYVITTLPQLRSLDGREIEKSERILAKQDYESIFQSIVNQESSYREELESKRREKKKCSRTNGEENIEDDDANFWQEQVEYTPESRLEIHRHMEEKQKETDENNKRTEDTAKEIRFFAKDGRPLNINQGKFEFKFTEDEEKNVLLFDLSCPKFLDTSLINVDIQTTYLRVTVKGKIMQLALPEEIKPDSSTAQRSQVTGHLLLTMPKLKGIVRPKSTKSEAKGKNTCETNVRSGCGTGSIKLEVDPTVRSEMDFSNIVQEKKTQCHGRTYSCKADATLDNSEFIDDPDVPPLV